MFEKFKRVREHLIYKDGKYSFNDQRLDYGKCSYNDGYYNGIRPLLKGEKKMSIYRTLIYLYANR